MNGGVRSSTARRVSWLGLFLILFGVLLLMRKMGVIDLRLREILWPLLMLVGIVTTGRGFADGRKGKIILGTTLFLYSIFFFMRMLSNIYIPIDMLLPATFLIFGIVCLMLFINRPADWYYLIPGVFLLGIGAMMVMAEYGYWYYWEVSEVLRQWWPAVLVLFGIGLLLRRRDSRRVGEVGTGESPHSPDVVDPIAPEKPSDPEGSIPNQQV